MFYILVFNLNGLGLPVDLINLQMEANSEKTSAY